MGEELAVREREHCICLHSYPAICYHGNVSNGIITVLWDRCCSLWAGTGRKLCFPPGMFILSNRRNPKKSLFIPTRNMGGSAHLVFITSIVHALVSG